MDRLEQRTHRPLAYDWDHRFGQGIAPDETVPSHSGLVVIDDEGQPHPLAGRELARQGLGHIVTTSVTVPPQRKPPAEETMTLPPTAEAAGRNFRPDPSIFLG